jgi:hypothetical protein
MQLDPTKKWIIIVAIIVLIIYLIFIGIAMYLSQYNHQFPPVIPECPDYWNINDKNMCINGKKIGSCLDEKDLEIDLNDLNWKGKSGLCRKYQFAKRCNLQWDGISDNIKLCQ